MGGFFGLDVDGDTYLLTDLAGVTDMWMELDVNGNMQLRTVEADPHFPTQPQVENGVVFGYGLEFTGTFAGGSPSPTPTSLSIAPVPADDIWQVSVSGVIQGSTNFIYEHGTNALLYTLSSSSGQVPELANLGGRYVYVKSQVGTASLSSRFPAAAGVLVAELHAFNTTITTYTQITKNVMLGIKNAEITTVRRDSQNLLETNVSGKPL